MEFDIKKLEDVDIGEVLAIERVSFPTPWKPSYFLEEMKRPIIRAYAARLTDKNRALVGYIMSHVVMDELHILNIATHPDFRHKGVASGLIKHTIAKNPQVRVAYLEVREGNSVALDMYRKLGFREIGKRKGYYDDTGEDAITMAWISY